MQLTPDECLARAWTYCAPNRLVQPSLPYGGFPTGFWPDVARVAMAMFEQQRIDPILEREPSKCSRGDAPEIRVVGKLTKRTGIDVSKLRISI